ncbi:selenocysteine-specific translation elongation factor [Streptosporangium sp. NPDC049046]|uniref:selenocysteine-specific translation elongation factor n=1 Tax=Streptosporangium sp. NPDC049046 TaxID=3155031 RepID=UPI0034308DDB
MHVVATAGHVDHGKSTLVRALTGMEPDRWAEERRRGLTIDLGFAWRTMPSGRSLAFVDVPGHERFVTNMMAGIGPVPAVLMVVAADEGWMPQSAEHLAVIDALGVRHGLLVVTRSDRGDAELAIEEARLELVGTSLDGVPAVAVSSITGDGVDDLVTALDDLVGALPAPDDAAPVRLWIDRVFTVKGMGTVVTGTLPSGTVNVGDELQLSPSGRVVKVRGMESLKRKTERVTGVARVALNLKGVDLADCGRGMALVSPGRWTVTDTLDVRLRAGTSDLLPRESLLHVGSASVSVRVRRLGETTARLVLDHPLPLHVGDRVILRDPGSRRVTGLTVLDVRPPSLRRRGAAARVADEIADWPDPPTAHHLLARHRYLREDEFDPLGLTAVGRKVDGDWRVDPAWWVSQSQGLGALTKDYALRNPLVPTLPVEVARQLLGLPHRRLVEALVRPPLRIEAGRIHRPADRPRLPEAITAAVRRLERELETTPFQAPEAVRLAQLGLDSRAAIAAAKVGAVLRLAEGVVLPLIAEPRAVEILEELPQPFTASEARSALGTSRRVVIPLLEYLDERGHTVRVDNASRRVRSR